MEESTNMPSRNDPEFREFYQDLADFIRIFWEVHKQRLSSGEIPFANMSLATSLAPRFETYTEFDMQRQIEISSKDLNPDEKHPVIKYFADGVHSSIALSLLELLGLKDTPDSIKHIFPDPTYPLDKIKTIIDTITAFQGVNQGRPSQKTISNMVDDISGGMETGIHVSTHMAALSYAVPNLNSSRAALMISKISGDYLVEAQTDIGIDIIAKEGEFDSHYSLIDSQASNGLNMDLLRQFGYGRAIGCPASMKPSTECIEFLKTIPGVDEVSGTVTEELADIINEQFPHYVLSWFESLPQQQRELLIQPDHLAKLEGRIPTSYRGTKKFSRYTSLAERVRQRLPEPKHEVFDTTFFLNGLVQREGYRENFSQMVRETHPAVAIPGGNIVDLACGIGASTSALATEYQQPVTGIDLNQTAIDNAKRWFYEPLKVMFLQGDAYEFEKYVDKVAMVTIYSALHEIDDLDRLFSQVYDALLPNGVFSFVDPHNREALMYKKHILHELDQQFSTDILSGSVEDVLNKRQHMSREEFLKYFSQSDVWNNNPQEYGDYFFNRGGREHQMRILRANSLLAAYTPDEVQKELLQAGFKTINMNDKAGGIVGYAVKS